MSASTFPLGGLQMDAKSGRSFRLRLPRPERPTCCLVLLHGVGSNDTHLLELTTGVDPGTLVAVEHGISADMQADSMAWVASLS